MLDRCDSCGELACAAVWSREARVVFAVCRWGRCWVRVSAELAAYVDTSCAFRDEPGYDRAITLASEGQA